MTRTKVAMLVLGLWVFACLSIINVVNHFIPPEDVEAYTVATNPYTHNISSRSNGWSIVLATNDPHDATAVDTISCYIGFADATSLALWTKADENAGSVHLKIEYEFFIEGAGWAGEAGVPQELIADMATAAWQWQAFHVVATAGHEVPGAFADSIRIITTGLGTNGSDIDKYYVLSGSW